MTDEDLVECAACGNHVDALYTIDDMYGVCNDCVKIGGVDGPVE